ncbi:hypothetical protein PIROE2DRAFT_6494, partial [Piromyces sp. E2]
KQENIKYKNQWDKFVAIAEAKKKKKSQGKRPELITNTQKIINEDGNNSDIESPHLFNKPPKNSILPPKYSSNPPPLQLFKNPESTTKNNFVNQIKLNNTSVPPPPIQNNEDKETRNMVNPSSLNDKYQQNQLYFSSPTPEFDILQHMNYHQEIASQSNQLYSSMINQPTNNVDYPFSPMTSEDIYPMPTNLDNKIKKDDKEDTYQNSSTNIHTEEEQQYK